MSVKSSELSLDLGHLTLAARVYGPADGAPMLALHGWLDNAGSFVRLAPRLEGLRIVALDLAGHGRSGHRPPGGDYHLPGYVEDVLGVADRLGWQRFGLLGHSLGAVIAVQLAGALPERVDRLALIDGVLPPRAHEQDAASRLGMALQARLRRQPGRKRVYASFEEGVRARMNGQVPVSHDAAERLALRGLEPVPEGFSWRSDSRLTLPSPVRLTQGQALSFVQRIACPTQLIVATDGLLAHEHDLLAQLPFEQVTLPGGHHLHLNDERGASLVADCFNRFLRFA